MTMDKITETTNDANSDTSRGLVLDGTKIAWHRERVEAWLRGERIAPITVDMSLTRACNYKCEYCYGTLQENPRKPITQDVMFRFLDDAAEIGVKGVSFVSDGESSVAPIFPQCIVHGSENGLSMAMGTNGYLVTREKLEQILPHLTYFRFNISAGDPKRYSEIHGVPEAYFHQVCQNIRDAMEIKRSNNLPVTIGMQMVLMPQYADQIMPLARLGRELLPDYLVIKHCSDDESGSLGVQYQDYRAMYETLHEAEALSTDKYLVKVKWSKIQDEGGRSYSQCYGPPFLIQLSGSGLVAPCGMLFGEKYKKYWIGNIVDTSFKEIWQSDRYWEVMNEIASPRFDARSMCGCLCVQHKPNEFLWALKQGNISLKDPEGPMPMHINFV